MAEERIKIGTKVMWKGAWGMHPAKEAEIESIERVKQGTKFGRSVKSIAWSTIKDRNVIVNLTNGYWAWGNQLSPI